MLIRLNKVTKNFPQKNLFKDVSFSIHKKERCGLIGLNGTGKTTLINMIMGKEQDYAGTIEKPNSVRIGCLSQEMFEGENRTLKEIMLTAFPDIIKTKQQLEILEKTLNESPENQKKFGDLQHKFEEMGGYELDHNIEKILFGLSFTEQDFTRSLSNFSGGEKRRAGLAFLLLQMPDLLILDEPTNHLDIGAVRWLENFLANLHQGLLIISHDRYFLDKTVNKIFEIDNNNIFSYTGGYEAYLKQKQERIELQEKERKKQEEYIKKTEEFIRRNIAGQKTKLAKSRRKALEKIDRISRVHIEERNILINNWDIPKSFEHVIHIDKLSKNFGSRKLLDQIDLDVYRGEKIALIGSNGSGKTTFLKIISDKIEADGGLVDVKENVSPFYFSQELDLVKGKESIMDFIHNLMPMSTELEVRKLLAWFYFRSDEINTPLDSLSGGEKSRIMILRLLLSKANLLLLDEPTNHLDIYTRESLAEALIDYPGTILFVSHDRYFINTIADKILLLNNGNFKILDGNFTENEEEILNYFSSGLSTGREEKKVKQPENIQPKEKKKNVNVYKVQKIEEEIEQIEKEIEVLENEKLKPENYEDGRKIKEIDGKISALNSTLNEKFEVWENYQ